MSYWSEKVEKRKPWGPHLCLTLRPTANLPNAHQQQNIQLGPYPHSLGSNTGIHYNKNCVLAEWEKTITLPQSNDVINAFKPSVRRTKCNFVEFRHDISWIRSRQTLCINNAQHLSHAGSKSHAGPPGLWKHFQAGGSWVMVCKHKTATTEP